MRKSSLKYVLVAGLTLVTSFGFAASGQASGNLQPAAATGAPVGALDGSGIPLKIRIGGTNGIPVDASAVALNVTAVGTQAPATGGYITVYPCGDRPNASNLNFISGQTLANSVITPMSANGDVCLYVYGIANLVVDVSGYVPAAGFATVSAANSRFLDTRPETEKVGKLDGTGTAKELQITGTAGIPAGISAVAMNVTAVDTEASDVGGYVTVYPCGERPNTSNINFVSGQTIPNSVIVPVSASGKVCFYVYGKADILADVSGYFPTGSLTSLSKPERLLDTRQSTQVGTIDGSGLAKELQVTGTFGIPTGISAVAMNVTAVNTEANDFGGYVTVYPCGTKPTTSTLNFISNQTVPNSLIAPVSGAGKICIYVYGKADILVDVSAHITTTNFTSLSSPARLRDTRNDTKLGANALIYDFSDAVAVGVAANSVARASLQVAEGRRVAQDVDESNLIVISEDGTTETAAVNGSARIAHTLTSPDGSVYVLYDVPTNLDDNGTETCLLARVDIDTGLPTCDNANLSQVFWPDYSQKPSLNDPVQFDADGNVYYSGIVNGDTQFIRWDPVTNTTTTLLEKTDFPLVTHADGRANTGISVSNFLTLPDGQSLVTGAADVCDFSFINNVGDTTANARLADGTSVADCYEFLFFVYAIDSDGTIHPEVVGNASFFMKRHPDDKVRLAFDDRNRFGIYTWNETTNRVDTAPYMVDYRNETTPTPSCNNQRAVCTAPHQSWAYYDVGGKVVSVAPSECNSNQCPTPLAPLEVSYVYPNTRTRWVTSYLGQKPDFARVIGDKLILYGTNQSGGHIVTVVDVSGATPIGQILIGPGATNPANRTDITMYDADFLPESNEVIFSGALASGQLVTGTYDLATGTLSVTNIAATGVITDIEAIAPVEVPG